FDYIPVAQALPAFDPRFQDVFDRVSRYLTDPETLRCVVTQPEICNDAGYAPRNTPGSLALFGDVDAKGGNADGAEMWYGLALALAGGGSRPSPFLPAREPRATGAAGRGALSRAAAPGNAPGVSGGGAGAGPACHTR